jgi:hypothetical protein
VFRAENPKTLHHCHIKGVASPLAICAQCNLKIQLDRDLIVYFHGGSNYDLNLVVQALSVVVTPEDKIDILAKTQERYSCIKWNRVKFADSMSILNDKLSNLAGLLEEGDDELFKIHYDDPNKVSLMRAKLVFPFRCCTSIDRMLQTICPPDISLFTNDLTGEGCDTSEYKRFCDVWDIFKCSNLFEAMVNYNQFDVLLTAAVFCKFRQALFADWELDIAHFQSISGFSWACALKMKKVPVERIRCAEVYKFVMASQLGGLAFTNVRFAQANNKHLPAFNQSLPESYLLNFDINSCYLGIQRDWKMPTGNFKFLTKAEQRAFKLDDCDRDGPTGYIVQCSVEFPTHLHSYLHQLPPCPTKRVVSREELSPSSQRLLKDNDIHLPKLEKIVLDLHSKRDYICSAPLLQCFVNLGAQITDINRVLSFDQNNVFGPIMQKCYEARQLATSVFSSNLQKLLANSVFGRSILRETNFRDIHLVFTKQSMTKFANHPRLKRVTPCEGLNVVIVELARRSVRILAPVQLGVQTLSFSKIIFYDFFYHALLKNFPNSVLLGGDTDGMLVHVFCEDFYSSGLAKLKQHMDLSNYPLTHEHFDSSRKKQPLFWGDVNGGRVALQAVYLSPKTYSVLFDNEDNTARSKGIPKRVQKCIRHTQYVTCLKQNSAPLVHFNSIHGKHFTLNTLQEQKKMFCFADTKRYWDSKLIYSLPFGYRGPKPDGWEEEENVGQSSQVCAWPLL